MTYRGHISNGVVVLDEPANLPEGTSVQVAVPDDSVRPGRNSLLDRLGDIVGAARDLPPDASLRIERDLYGRGRT